MLPEPVVSLPPVNPDGHAVEPITVVVPLYDTQPDSVPVFWNVTEVFTAPIPFPVDGRTPMGIKFAFAFADSMVTAAATNDTVKIFTY